MSSSSLAWSDENNTWDGNFFKINETVGEFIDLYEKDEIFSSRFFYIDPVTNKLNSADLDEINTTAPIIPKKCDLLMGGLQSWSSKEEIIFDLMLNPKGDFIEVPIQPKTSFKEVLIQLFKVIRREDENEIKYSENKSINISQHTPWEWKCDCKNKFERLASPIFSTQRLDSFVTFVNFVFVARETSINQKPVKVGVEMLKFRLLCKCDKCLNFSSKWKK